MAALSPITTAATLPVARPATQAAAPVPAPVALAAPTAGGLSSASAQARAGLDQLVAQANQAAAANGGQIDPTIAQQISQRSDFVQQLSQLEAKIDEAKNAAISAWLR